MATPRWCAACWPPAGAAVNTFNEWGRSALCQAAEGSHTDVVRRLLAAGTSPLLANYGGWLPLHAAAYQGEVAARLLLEAAPQAALLHTRRVDAALCCR